MNKKELYKKRHQKQQQQQPSLFTKKRDNI